MKIPTWRIEILTQTEENEYLREQYSLINEPTTILLNKQNVRELLIEKSTSDLELQKIFSRYSEEKSNRIEELIKSFVEYLRKSGYRELKKYVVVELFKRYYYNTVYRRYQNKIYYIRKIKRIQYENRCILLFGKITEKEKNVNLTKYAKK